MAVKAGAGALPSSCAGDDPRAPVADRRNRRERRQVDGRRQRRRRLRFGSSAPTSTTGASFSKGPWGDDYRNPAVGRLWRRLPVRPHGCGRWRRTSSRRSSPAGTLVGVTSGRYARRSASPAGAITPTTASCERRSFATAGTGRSRTSSSKPESDVLVGRPSLYVETSVGVPQDAGPDAPEAGAGRVVRAQAYSVRSSSGRACHAAEHTCLVFHSRPHGLPRSRRPVDA